MTEPDREQILRTLRAQINAHKSWALTENRSARTRNGRKTFHDKFLAEVGGDPSAPHRPVMATSSSWRSSRPKPANYPQAVVSMSPDKKEVSRHRTPLPAGDTTTTPISGSAPRKTSGRLHINAAGQRFSAGWRSAHDRRAFRGSRLPAQRIRRDLPRETRRCFQQVGDAPSASPRSAIASTSGSGPTPPSARPASAAAVAPPSRSPASPRCTPT